MSTITITIDPPTRDVLHQDLVYELEGAGDTLTHLNSVTRDDVERAINHVAWALSMLDTLGFEQRRNRDRYELPVDEQACDWLRKLRAEKQESVDYERDRLHHLEAGDEDYCHVGRSMCQSTERQRLYVEKEQMEMEIVGQLLGELDELIGAVA